jgi:hypothetical protein
MSMEETRGPQALARSSGATKVAPPNPTERLCEALDSLGTAIDNIQSAAHRAHERTYGEYQYAPSAEDEAPEFGGRVGEMMQRVRTIRRQADQALELVESLESNA